MEWTITVTRKRVENEDGDLKMFSAKINDSESIGYGDSLQESVDDLLDKLNDEVPDEERCPPMNDRGI